MARSPATRFSILLSRLPRLLLLAPVFLLHLSCAQTSIRPFARTPQNNLPAPARILVYDFAVSDAAVTEYQGILRQKPSTRDPLLRQRALAARAAETLTAHLIVGLRRLGLTVERVQRGAPVNPDDVIVDGRFITVNEGNPLRRLVIGFGSGASNLDTQVQLLRAGQGQPLLKFATRADSGKVPGAIATVPASVAAPTAVSTAMAAGAVVHTGLHGDSSNVGHMAEASAEQAVRYLSEFFANQGWIIAVKKARAGH